MNLTLPGVPEIHVAAAQAKPGPWEIIAKALAQFKPIAIYACYSGGNDSLQAVHWAMTNIPGCKVLHINTGIGIERTREHVRKTCKAFHVDDDEVFGWIEKERLKPSSELEGGSVQ